MRKSTAKLAGLIAAAIVSGVATISELFITTPKKLGPNGVTFWFISLLALVVSVLSLVLFVFKIQYLQGRTNLNKTVNASFRTAFLIGVGLVAFIALRSLGSLSFKDIILLSLMLILIEFYLRTRRTGDE